MSNNEAQARIKINNLLKEAGWRFFDEGVNKANIQLEKGVKITEKKLSFLGEDFENCSSGRIDYLLIDDKKQPLIVLEAKSEKKDPLDGKEQARRYAESINARFVILSNGNIHYFWDLSKGNPEVITRLPSPNSITHQLKLKPNPEALASTKIAAEYILECQEPNYISEPQWIDPKQREMFLATKNYRVLRDYQLKAIKSLQKAVAEGKNRFLFEMATGTGKTLVAAAVIRLFISSGNALRVLFLVDRIELERQAEEEFGKYLGNDYRTVIYKKNREDWNKANIVVSTVQSLSDKHRQLFSPTDFDLIISDEAHRSINGNARALFEYFGGYKLGLTATPKDYLKNLDIEKLQELDPRSYERRNLLDTYKTFGCENSEPTFRYSLNEGVKDGYLLSPTVVDVRSDITAQLLSDEGYAVMEKDEDGNLQPKYYNQKDFERKFFSESTNRLICKTFIDNALKDPLSKEIGKSIIFCVSQDHAAKITKTLNELADEMYPGKYNSNFAVQVTSRILNSQQLAANFQNNKLLGYTKFLEGYKSSKTRVCVTVGMMTTGYDCPDLLNIALLRPIFSPADFIQIKGRGTRKHAYKYRERYNNRTVDHIKVKETFKLFDYFANCEYFEEEFNYDEILELPKGGVTTSGLTTQHAQPIVDDTYNYKGTDAVSELKETLIGYEGMRIDREMFNSFANRISKDEYIVEKVTEDDYEAIDEYINEKYFEKPEDYLNLNKLRKSMGVDWLVPLRQILELIFKKRDRIKGKYEVLDDEFDNFLLIHKPESHYVPTAKRLFKAYITDEEIRAVVNAKEYAKLSTSPKVSLQDIMALNGWRETIPQYVKDYVPLSYFKQ